METEIFDMDLSVRAYNSLKRAGITTYSALFSRIDEGIPSLFEIRFINTRCVGEVLKLAQKNGYPANEKVEEYIADLRKDPDATTERIAYWEALSDSLRLIKSNTPNAN